MRRVAHCVVPAAIVAVTMSAQAADLPVKAIPIPPPIMTWTGFYLGGNAGYSWGDWNTSGAVGYAQPNVAGWVIGAQAGHNWQFSANGVAGVEGDIQFTGQKANETAFVGVTDVAGGPPPFADPLTFHTITTTYSANEWKLPWFATFRGRIGGLVDPTTLIYGTAGVAVGHFKGSAGAFTSATTYRGAVGTTNNPVLGPVITAGLGISDSTTRLGWTVGAGVEKKFTPNWSAKIEYLYLDFGTQDFGPFALTQVKLRDNIGRVGVNYQFR